MSIKWGLGRGHYGHEDEGNQACVAGLHEEVFDGYVDEGVGADLSRWDLTIDLSSFSVFSSLCSGSDWRTIIRGDISLYLYNYINEV